MRHCTPRNYTHTRPGRTPHSVCFKITPPQHPRTPHPPPGGSPTFTPGPNHTTITTAASYEPITTTPPPAQLIATACLFLATKIEESPKMLRSVITEIERIRHAKNLEALRVLDDPVRLAPMGGHRRAPAFQRRFRNLYLRGFTDPSVQPL